MVFTLLLAFGAKTGQPQQIQGGALCLAEQPGQIVSKIEDGGDDQPKENKAGESFGKQQREQIEPVAWIKGSPMITIIQKNQDMSFLRPVSSARVLIDRPPFAMTMHLKPLYLYNRKVHLEGVPVSWVLVDSGAAVNILPWSVLNRLGKNKDDLLPTDLCIINFTGGISKTMGVFPADMTVGSKTALTAFFVVKAAASYKVLVGRDWIHAWMVVPSSLHQLLVFWNGNDAEIIWADEEPLIVKVHAQEAFLYQENVGPVRFLGQS